MDCSFTEYTTLYACLRGRRGFPRLSCGQSLRKMPPPWVGQTSRYHLVSCCCWMGSIDQKPESIALAKMLVLIPEGVDAVRIIDLLNGIDFGVLGVLGMMSVNSVAVRCGSPCVKLIKSGRWCWSCPPSSHLIRPRRTRGRRNRIRRTKMKGGHRLR